MGMKMLNICSEFGPTSPVLLWDNDDLVLVDSSLPMNTDAICVAIKQAGHDPANLTKIILTHHDIDHVGCVRDLMDRYSGIQVLCHKEEAPYVQGEQVPIKLAALPEDHMIRKAYEKRVVPVDCQFVDGDVLPICGGIRVVHTPGHTPGHCCLYVVAERTLIAGDAMVVVDGKLCGPMPDHAKDIKQAVASIKQLPDLDIDKVFAFHGGLFDGDVRTAIESI